MPEPSDTTRSAARAVRALFAGMAALGLFMLAVQSYVSDEPHLALGVAAVALLLAAYAAPVLGRAVIGVFTRWWAERKAERHATRELCPCCGFPTLARAGDGEPCPVCEWPNDDAPSPLDPAPALAEARANFKRYWSVYPPHSRPAWSPAPASPEELARRRHLAQSYAAARAGLKVRADAIHAEEARVREQEFRELPPE